LATLGFILLLALNERSSIVDYINYQKQLNKLRKQNQYYKSETDRISREYNEVFGSAENIEKFAREKYFMKRDSEDVFIIVPEEN